METKPFYKTSEFWMTIATNALAFGAQMAGTLPPQYGIPVQAAVNLGYALSRGIAKSGVPPEPVVVPVPIPPPVPTLVTP